MKQQGLEHCSHLLFAVNMPNFPLHHCRNSAESPTLMLAIFPAILSFENPAILFRILYIRP